MSVPNDTLVLLSKGEPLVPNGILGDFGQTTQGIVRQATHESSLVTNQWFRLKPSDRFQRAPGSWPTWELPAWDAATLAKWLTRVSCE